MAGIKISDLPAAPSAQLTDVFPVDQLPGPVTYKESNSQLLSLFQANGAALTKTDDTNVTMSLGGSPSTALLNATSMTLGWTGQLSISRGGTATNSFTAFSVICGGTTSTGALQSVVGVGTSGEQLTSNGPGMLPTWQPGTAVTPAALTKVDDTNVTLTLGGTPSTALLQATSITAGWAGTLSETRGGTAQSTYTLGDTLYSSAANTLSKLAGNTTTAKQYLSQTGTGAVSAAPAWATVSGSDITGAALTKTDDTNVTLTLGGTPTTALLRAASITAGWTGQLGLTRGGTAASLTASNGGIVYSNASTLAILAGTATANQVLLSGASTTPSWSTATYPATAGTSGNVLTSDGTNFVSSAPSAGSATSITVTQASHGFSVNNALYLVGTTYTLAIATSLPASQVVGIVSNVANVNTFTLQMTGRLTGLSGLTAGGIYYLSDGTPGLPTLTIPTTSTSISRPLYAADSTTSAILLPCRPIYLSQVPTLISVTTLVVGAGASGGADDGGGGGAGGAVSSSIQLQHGQVYTATIGAGGGASSQGVHGVNGNNSTLAGTGLSTVTGTGGGGGGFRSNTNDGTGNGGANGGCGGGGADTIGGGAGAGGGTGSQGFNGGTNNAGAAQSAGGGGGMGAVGADGSSSNGGAGGNGVSSSITGSAVTYAGGGGGSSRLGGGGTGGAGGSGGGGAGTNTGTGVNGTANLGGGGGGASITPGTTSGSGGSGVVIINVATSDYTGTTTGSPTITTSGSQTIIKFTGTGTYTA